MQLENFKLIVKMKLKEIYSKNEEKLNGLDQMIQETEKMVKNISEFEYNKYEIRQKEKEAIEALTTAKEKLKKIKVLTEESMKVEVECPNCKKIQYTSAFYIEGKFKYINEKIVCIDCLNDEIKINNSISFKKGSV